MTKTAVAFTVFITLAYSNIIYARSATASAQSIQTVFGCLSIHKKSDLNFGEAPQGDPAKTVIPAQFENSENASFEVEGERGVSFSIILPSDNTIKMTVDGGGLNREIAVNKFTSYPHGQVTIGLLGEEHIYVGATRNKLSSSQKPGKYVGTFTVTVVY